MRALNLLLISVGLWNFALIVQTETFDPEKGYVGIVVLSGKNSDFSSVTYVAANGPAALAGIKIGDNIVIIDGLSAQGLSPMETMHLIDDGKAGSTVEITLRREGAADIKVTVTRKTLLDTYWPVATGDDPKAQFRIGYFYEFSPTPNRDPAKAIEWYRKAADQDYAPAQTDLGYMYGHGLGVTEDDETSSSWYLKAARQGDAVAERDLALGYLKGKGVQQSDQDAFNWFYSAAQQDDATAEEYLGFLYRKGRGVARNDQAAFAWYYRSAERNDPYGQESLAYMYVHGLGVAHDNVEALKWYLKAQVGLPKSKSLKKAIALATLGAFLENRSSVSTLDLSLLVNAFQQEIWYLFIGLTVVYFAGGFTLLYFTFHAPNAPPRLSVALGWIGFYLESQGVAFLTLCIFESEIGADTFVGVTSLLCALPVIISSCGPARTRIWKSSPFSWKGLLLYGTASLIAMALIGLGYEKIYPWIAHSSLPAQPTLALIGKTKDTSALVAFLTIALLLPVTEEIIFRSYLFEALRRFFSGEITVIISALAFAAIHFQLLYFVPLFGFGLICGWVRLKTDSLRLPVFLHVINNGLLLALAI
jgi:TPR repeat protein/membrane protease YdiL (CAAX protease family)